MTGTLLKSLSRPALRGSARRDGEWITYTCTGIDSTAIDAEPQIGMHLARVRTPDEALAFVQRYGPVHALPDGLLRGEDVVRAVSTLKQPIEVREPVQDILQAADQLADVVLGALDARKTAGGDEQARARVTRWAQANDKADPPYGAVESTLSLLLAMDLTDQLQGARLHVKTIEPGRFELRVSLDTLLGYCYLDIARRLAAKERIAVCAECSRVFVVEDGRQKFCEARCAGRARWRRFNEKESSLAHVVPAAPIHSRRKKKRVASKRKARP